MTLKIYSVYDSKAEFFRRPFFMKTNGEALRSWIEIANDGESEISKYPADFTLFEIGHFDEVKGTISMLDAKVPLGTALEHKNQPVPGLQSTLPFPSPTAQVG